MRGVGNPGDDIRIGLIEQGANFLWSLDRPPNMRVGRDRDPHLQRSLADFGHGFRDRFDVLRRRAVLRATPHVDLEVRTAENLQEISAEGNVVGDRFLTLGPIDELRRLTGPAVRGGNKPYAVLVEEVLQRLRFVKPGGQTAAVRFNARQTVLGNQLDGFGGEIAKNGTAHRKVDIC